MAENASKSSDKPKDTRSAAQIERDIAANRRRLASNVDEIVFRAHPKELARRQTEALKLKANDAVSSSLYDDGGDLRGDRVAKGLGGLGGALFTVGALRRLMHKG